MPYPYAGAHQMLNAAYLAQQQAAVIVKNAELDEKLKSTVLDLLSDKEKLEQMKQACLNLGQPAAARRLAREIREVYHGGH